MKTGDRVIVWDDSYHVVITEDGLTHKSEGGGYGKNRSPWIFIEGGLSLPSEIHPYTNNKQVSDCIIIHPETKEVMFTQERFLRPIICPTCKRRWDSF